MRSWASRLGSAHPTIKSDLEWVLSQRRAMFFNVFYSYVENRQALEWEEEKEHDREYDGGELCDVYKW